MSKAFRTTEPAQHGMESWPRAQGIRLGCSKEHFSRRRPSILYLPVIAILNLAGLAEAWAGDPINAQSITVETLQSTVRELRAQQPMARKEEETAASSVSPRPEISPPAQAMQPRGATAHHSGPEAKVVTAPITPNIRGATKKIPDPPPGGASSPAVVPQRNTTGVQQIGYSSASFIPERGIDQRILSATETAQGRPETYAFLLLNEALTAEIEKDLQSLNVTVLGPHDDALKVRIPLRRDALEVIAAKPYVHSISYGLPEQKIAGDLDSALKSFASEVSKFPIIVNLFDNDPNGNFVGRMRALGVEVTQYDPTLKAYMALASSEEVRKLAELDFVLFIEIERRSESGHDQSMPTNGIDYIRAAGFSGAPVVLGILDTGFMLGTAAPTMHQDLNKNGCGRNFTTDAAGVWNDQNGHGTHVLGTIAGTGTADSRYRGAATAAGGAARPDRGAAA